MTPRLELAIRALLVWTCVDVATVRRPTGAGVGLAARHATETSVATLQLANTGLVSLSYLQKVSDKVSLASDFMYNWNSREASASFGYDYVLRQCRLRGRIDTGARQTRGAAGAPPLLVCRRPCTGPNHPLSAQAWPLSLATHPCGPRTRVACYYLCYLLLAEGKVAAYLEERLNVGVNFILSAELDHSKKDYKFGWGACAHRESNVAPLLCAAAGRRRAHAAAHGCRQQHSEQSALLALQVWDDGWRVEPGTSPGAEPCASGLCHGRTSSAAPAVAGRPLPAAAALRVLLPAAGVKHERHAAVGMKNHKQGRRAADRESESTAHAHAAANALFLRGPADARPPRWAAAMHAGPCCLRAHQGDRFPTSVQGGPLLLSAPLWSSSSTGSKARPQSTRPP